VSLGENRPNQLQLIGLWVFSCAIAAMVYETYWSAREAREVGAASDFARTWFDLDSSSTKYIGLYSTQIVRMVTSK
jgi:hypothetical protein